MKIPSAWLALAVLLLLLGRSSASTNLYSSHFERSEGYNSAYELLGQNGWVTDSASYGGNGLVTNFLGGQAAYIGLFPLAPIDSYLDIWQPLNYSPVLQGMPVVRFSVVVSIVDSTTTNYDDFYWSVYNQQGHALFTIDFFNGDLGVYYFLDGTNSPFVFTGKSFTNEVAYMLRITMDFANNIWSATLDGTPLVGDQPMTVTGAPLNLGDIDALWIIANPAKPGDNFMIFDNYQVTADAAVPVRLSSLGRAANGQFQLRLTGPSGARFAIDASANLFLWTALKTNVISNGSFDFVDTAASGLARRFYRARKVL